MKHARPAATLNALIVSIGLAACGGGGSDSNPAAAASAAAPSSNAAEAPHASSAATATSTQATLSLPSAVADGSVVELECGRTYRGTLDLRGKTNVSVKTGGDCGKAVIAPGQEIGGWTQHQGNIYSAPIAFAPAQLLVDGQPLALAHWPNRTQTWAKAEASNTGSLRYPMPNGDLAGATLLFKPYDWAVEARTVTGYANGTMTLTATGNPEYDGYPLAGQPEFYVEGKLWMLDEPGEWAVRDGRVYLWAPDGKSPQGRAWAAPDRHGIDASDSNGIVLDGVSVFAAANGIHAPGAKGLQVRNVDIANSARNGIMNSGGSSLLVEAGSIRNSRHDAIAVKWGGGGETIRNVRVDGAGTLGMPVNVHAAINLTAGSGATVSGNTVTNAGYIGIRSFRDSTVADNVIDGACLTLTDCGGIFNSAPDGKALNARIERNTIRKVGVAQRLAWAIYLSEGAGGVTVTDNTIAGNGNGLLIFDGADNKVSGNAFSVSTQAHIQMVETVAGRVRRNSVLENTFSARDGEQTYRISSDAGTASVAQFAAYDRNRYSNSSPVFANFNGEALDYAQWRTRSGQDAASTITLP
jgi:parallel beta-helix repeat protein